MEPTYTMIGGDGQQYGPVTLDQLKGWLGEGRIANTTKIKRSDHVNWLTADQYAELSAAQPSIIAPPKTAPLDPALVRRARVGARWFFWIAGLSLVNTFMARSSTHTVFVIGLGVTQVIDQLVAQIGANHDLALMVNVIISGVFAGLGVLAWQQQGWAYIVGMILYALDGVLFLLTKNWLGLGFHVFVLFWMFSGWKANQQSKARTY